MDGDDETQADGGFGCGDGDGENSEHHAGKQFGMRAEAPEGDQVEVGGVQHELNADEHENGVAAHERAGEADGEEQSRNEEITGERRGRAHYLALSFSCMATMTAPMVAAVSSRPTISSGST